MGKHIRLGAQLQGLEYGTANDLWGCGVGGMITGNVNMYKPWNKFCQRFCAGADIVEVGTEWDGS